jgi:hypothetical protein
VQVQLVVFSAPKEGYAPYEWEDGACGVVLGDGRGTEPSHGRFIVVDGATEAWETRRWVDQLVTSFMSPDGPGGVSQPDLERGAISAWIQQMQGRWLAEIPAPSDYIEQQKIKQGSLATFLGCQLTGLDGESPSWCAAALGDTVLFHVRGDRLLTCFPALGSADFGPAPEGISTRPEYLARMSDRMLFQRGRLAPGDTLFAATDAFAKWVIVNEECHDEALWPMLDSLVHPAVFDRLVDEQRTAGTLEDDDVTLMRIRFLPFRPSSLVVCV